MKTLMLKLILLTFGAFMILNIPVISPAAPVIMAAASWEEKFDNNLQQELAAAAPTDLIEVVITFADMNSAPQLGALTDTFIQMESLPMAGAILTAAQVEEVAQWAAVESIAWNAPLDFFLAESVPLIRADSVWESYNEWGADTTVAVIDSGVDATHPDLLFGEKVIQNVKVLPYNASVENVPHTDTTSGHGTHVAGTIAGLGTMSGGHYRGVAPGADIVGLGAGEALFILSAVQAYDWVITNHAQYNIRIISNSWGTSGGDLDLKNPVVRASYEAYSDGILSLFAAGNDGGYDVMNPYSIAPWVLSVAAGDKEGELADFSSRGKDGDFYKHPDITAPGVDIYATRDSTVGITALDPYPNPVNPAWTAHYTKMSGTSMATPHVSGAAALLLSHYPDLSPDQVIDILTETSRPMSDYLFHEAGYGYMDVMDAFAAAENVTGNLTNFLNGEQKYGIDYVLGFDPNELTFTTTTYRGYSAVGVTGTPANEYPIVIDEDTAYIVVDLSWEPAAEDAYDMELLNPDGVVVASSGNSAGEAESLMYLPGNSGTYTLRINPFAGVNAAYEAVVTTAYGNQDSGWPPHQTPAFDYYLGVTGVYKSYGLVGLRTAYYRSGDDGFISFTVMDADGVPTIGAAEQLQLIYADADGTPIFIDDQPSDAGDGSYRSRFVLDDNWHGFEGEVTVYFNWLGTDSAKLPTTAFYWNHLETSLTTPATNYMPGDTIAFSGNVQQWQTIGTGDIETAPAGGAEIWVELINADGMILATAVTVSDENGDYNSELTAPASTRGPVTLRSSATYDELLPIGSSSWQGNADVALIFPGNLAPEGSLRASLRSSRYHSILHFHATITDPDGNADISELSAALYDDRGRLLRRWKMNQFSPIDNSWMITRGTAVNGSGPWHLVVNATDSAGNSLHLEEVVYRWYATR